MLAQLHSEMITDEKTTELAALAELTNQAKLTRKIIGIQTRLIALAKDKTNPVTTCVSRTNQTRHAGQLSQAS